MQAGNEPKKQGWNGIMSGLNVGDPLLLSRAAPAHSNTLLILSTESGSSPNLEHHDAWVTLSSKD